MEYDNINAAIVRFVSSSWSRETEQEIKMAHGPEIATKTKAVYDAAMDCPVDWRNEDMNSALGILAAHLKAQFPWLTPEAKTRLNYCYILVWK